MPEFVSPRSHYTTIAPGQQLLVMSLKGNKQIGSCLKTNFMGNSLSEDVGSAVVQSQSAAAVTWRW